MTIPFPMSMRPAPSAIVAPEATEATPMKTADVTTTPTTPAPEATVIPPAPAAKAPKAAKAPRAPRTPKAKTVVADKAPIAFDGDPRWVNLADLSLDGTRNVTRPEGIDPEDAETVALGESLLTQGQQTPVITGPVQADGLLPVVAGFRRTTALAVLHAAGRHDGRVLVRVLVSMDDAVRVNLLENEGARKEITPFGRLAAFAALKEQGHDVTSIAAMLGRARDFVTDHFSLAKADPTVVEALRSDEISWAVARLLVRWSKRDQPTALAEVKGLSVLAAKVALDKLKAKLAAGEPEGEEEPEADEEPEGEEPTPGKLSPEARKLGRILALAGSTVLALDGEDGEDDDGAALKAALKALRSIVKIATPKDAPAPAPAPKATDDDEAGEE